MTARVAHLRGHLDVLLGIQEELHAIGASGARLEKNREAIARVRAELTRTDARRKLGDPTDATQSPGS